MSTIHPLRKNLDRRQALSAGEISSLPAFIQACAESFFNEDFSDVRLHLNQLPAAIGATAFARGNSIHLSSNAYRPCSKIGIALLGHELSHIVQQRYGKTGRARLDGDWLLEDSALEEEADALGQEFAAFCDSRTQPEVALCKPPAANLNEDMSGFPIQRQAWLRAHEKKPMDEYFWHATTTQNVKRIFDSNVIKPGCGGGGNGPGFYVAPFITDYIKVMAYRNLKPGDWSTMFILKILARDFYGMKPSFSDNGLAGAVGHDVGDFVAARWAAEISGDTSYRDPEGRMMRYDQYQGVNVPTIGFANNKKDFEGDEMGFKAKDAARAAAMGDLWLSAKANKILSSNKTIHDLMVTHGPRKAFLHSIEEITFKDSAGPYLHVVGARRFHTNDKPDDGLFARDVECSLDHVESVISLD